MLSLSPPMTSVGTLTVDQFFVVCQDLGDVTEATFEAERQSVTVLV